ncbi:MAG: FAD-dependent oxidoreductase, partial [Clostridia bacterium]
MKIVIVGGVAGGATTAARLRRLSEKDEIVLLEKDKYISYANCGLPYYIGDVITDKEKLQVQTVDGMSKRFNLDIRVKNEVVAVDKDKKTLTIRRLDSGEEYFESYDKLILSCGAKPIKPNIRGLAEAKNVFVLRNIPDTFAIKDFVNINKVKNATVIGGGFIGVEMAENLTQIGVKVTIVEKLPQTLKQLDFEMAQIVHQEMVANGVDLILGDGIAEFLDGGKKIKLDSGNEITTEMAILAIGVSSENTLAKSSGLKLGARGHVVVTDTFEVIDSQSDKKCDDIFAIGDMIEVIDALDGSPTAVPLAWGANRQGRLLADHINGIEIKPCKIQG